MSGRSIGGVATLLLVASLVGCSDGGGGEGNGAFSVVASLEQLPASVRTESVQITVADLNAATDAAGLERPDGGSPAFDELAAWLQPLTGISTNDVSATVAVLLPQAANPDRLAQIDEIRAEVGWTIADVDSFVEYQAPPGVFTVLNGDFSENDLEASLGDRQDNIWMLGDEDFGTDLDSVSAARPIGQSLRIGLDGDRLAVARETPPVSEWLAGDYESLGQDDGLLDVAEALDAARVYSALIVAGDPVSDAGSPFGVLGVGLAVIDGSPMATFVYRFDDQAAATEYAGRLETLLAEGTSARDARPWNEAFSIDQISTDGTLLVASLRLQDFAARNVWQIVFGRDNLAFLQ